MGKICYYSLDGKLQHEYELEKSLLDNLQSLMCRVYLKNGNTRDGYTNTEDLFRKNILKLWTQEFDVIEEWEVNYDEIERVDVLLSSHPMYGHKMMTQFEFEYESNKKLDNDEKHFYIYVEYIDMPNDRMYCYTSDDESIKRDDYVLVKRNQFEIPAKVINTAYYTDMEAPYPFSKLKHVIKKYPKEYKFFVDQEDDFYDDEDYGFCSYVGINEKEFIKFELNSFLIGKYEYKIYRATKNGTIKNEDKFYEAGLSDEKFDALLDKIKENYIDRWDKEYVDNNVLDGESWELEINTKDIKLKSSGMNAYPDNYDTFLYLLEINNVPIDEYYPVEENAITDDEEHEFISYFNKDVIIVFKNFKTLSGHCETFTRKVDSDYNEPELTIASKKGYIAVRYSEVLLIVSELDRIRTHNNRIGTIMAIYPNTTGMEVEFDDIAPKTETIDIKDVEEVLNNKKAPKEEKEKLKPNKISKSDFIKLKEDNILFITNPGRMGDEDGITFIVKSENAFEVYRVDGWMYGERTKDMITLDDAYKQFPKWHEAWSHGTEEDYKGKYKHLYMGFGNGLNVDNSIYDEFKPYLDEEVEKNFAKYSDKEKEEMKYAAIFNVWEKAFINMTKDKNYILK